MLSKYLSLSLILLFSSIPSLSHGQTRDVAKMQGRKFSKGVITMKDRRQHHATNLKFDSSNLVFQTHSNSQVSTLPLSEVAHVRARVGNHAGEGALFGGGLLLLSSIGAVLELESDPFTTVENPGQVILISTAIGAGIGLAIGAMFPKEKVIYKRGRFYTQHNWGDAGAVTLAALQIPF